MIIGKIVPVSLSMVNPVVVRRDVASNHASIKERCSEGWKYSGKLAKNGTNPQSRVVNKKVLLTLICTRSLLLLAKNRDSPMKQVIPVERRCSLSPHSPVIKKSNTGRDDITADNIVRKTPHIYATDCQFIGPRI
jgi:hypothetical protein